MSEPKKTTTMPSGLPSVDQLFDNDKRAWVDWKDGIRFLIKAVNRHLISQWLEECRVVEYDLRAKEKKESQDNEKFKRRMLPHVLAWKGLTYGKLSKLGNSFQDFSGTEHADTELPFDDAHKIALLGGADGLEIWLLDRMREAHTFIDAEVDREKKA
jgi:hypothetical protein